MGADTCTNWIGTSCWLRIFVLVPFAASKSQIGNENVILVTFNGANFQKTSYFWRRTKKHGNLLFFRKSGSVLVTKASFSKSRYLKLVCTHPSPLTQVRAGSPSPNFALARLNHQSTRGILCKQCTYSTVIVKSRAENEFRTHRTADQISRTLSKMSWTRPQSARPLTAIRL